MGMNKKLTIAVSVCVAVLLAAVSVGIYRSDHHLQVRTAIKSPATAPPAPAATALDPLTIAAIRAKSYPGSPITIEQTVGEQGGYSDQVASFQSDGFKIYTLISTPDGSPPSGGWPVIILDHGYIDPSQYATTGPEYRDFITSFTHAGYVVVKPDYRGHGKSQGVPEGGHFSPVYAYDNLNLIASLKNFNGVNPARIGLFGHSLGGHTALRTIVVSKDIKATVLLAGVVGSFDDIFFKWPHSPMPNDRPLAIVQGKRQELIDKYGDPKSNPTFWNSVSALNFVSNVTGVVQVNHDNDDSVVPKLFSDDLVAALRQAGKTVEYHTYPGDDHQFTANRAALLQNVLAFYRANL